MLEFLKKLYNRYIQRNQDAPDKKEEVNVIGGELPEKAPVILPEEPDVAQSKPVELPDDNGFDTFLDNILTGEKVSSSASEKEPTIDDLDKFLNEIEASPTAQRQAIEPQKIDDSNLEVLNVEPINKNVIDGELPEKQVKPQEEIITPDQEEILSPSKPEEDVGEITEEEIPVIESPEQESEDISLEELLKPKTQPEIVVTGDPVSTKEKLEKAEEQLDVSHEKVTDLIKDRALTEQEKLFALEKMYEDALKKDKEYEEKQLKHLETWKAKEAQFLKELDKDTETMAQSIDPNRFWNSISTGQKILSSFLAGIAGFAGGENPVLKNIRDSIENDIRAQIKTAELQRSAFTKKKTLYSVMLNRFKDKSTAIEALRATALKTVAYQVKRISNKFKGKDQIQAAEAIIAGLDKQHQLNLRNFYEKKLTNELKSIKDNSPSISDQLNIRRYLDDVRAHKNRVTTPLGDGTVALARSDKKDDVKAVRESAETLKSVSTIASQVMPIYKYLDLLAKKNKKGLAKDALFSSAFIQPIVSQLSKVLPLLINIRKSLLPGALSKIELVILFELLPPKLTPDYIFKIASGEPAFLRRVTALFASTARSAYEKLEVNALKSLKGDPYKGPNWKGLSDKDYMRAFLKRYGKDPWKLGKDDLFVPKGGASVQKSINKKSAEYNKQYDSIRKGFEAEKKNWTEKEWSYYNSLKAKIFGGEKQEKEEK